MSSFHNVHKVSAIEDTKTVDEEKWLQNDNDTVQPSTSSHLEQQTELQMKSGENSLEFGQKENPDKCVFFSLEDSSADSEGSESNLVFKMDDSGNEENEEELCENSENEKLVCGTPGPTKKIALDHIAQYEESIFCKALNVGLPQKSPLSSNDNFPFSVSQEEKCDITFSMNDSFNSETEDSETEVSDPIEPYQNFKRTSTETLHSSEKPENFLEVVLNKKSKLCSSCALNCVEKCEEKITMEKREIVINELVKDTKLDTKQAILDYLKNQKTFDLDTNKYHMGRTPVCIKFLSSVTNISEYILKKVLQDYKNGVVQYVHFNKSAQHDSLKTTKFISWFDNYTALIGDYSPSKNLIDLPSYIKKIAIYNEYRDNVLDNEAISESQFYYLLKYRYGSDREDKRIPHVRIPKQNTHTQCTPCLTIKNFRQTARTEIDKGLAESMLAAHHAIHRGERRIMKAGMQNCLDFPEDNVGFMPDGMDNSKTITPKSRSSWKQCAGMAKLKTHVTGVIIVSSKYAAGRKNKMFVNADQFAQDSNLTVTILHKSILDFVTEHEKLPPHLHLCLDNCWRENKNKYLFAYLYGLVMLGIVREITVYFLQVGHTHDMVDQLFSIIAEWLTKKEVSTLDQLIGLIETAPMTPLAEVEVLWNTNNFKDFISPLLTRPFLQNHSHLHGFNIKKEDGVTRFRGKALLQDELYGPATGIKLIKDDSNLMDKIEPTPFKIDNEFLEKLRNDIKSQYLPTLLPEKRNQVELSWDELIDKLEGLPTDEHLDVMSYGQLPKYTTPKASLSAASEVEKTIYKDPPALVGDIIPARMTLGTISEARVGADVVVYTRDKKGRPWVGRIVSVDQSSRKFSLNWFKRNAGRSNTWTSMKNEEGVKFVQDLEFEVAMMYGFGINRSEETFDISPHYQKVIRESYEHHDLNFES